jgi:hypothetical protein
MISIYLEVLERLCIGFAMGKAQVERHKKL